MVLSKSCYCSEHFSELSRQALGGIGIAEVDNWHTANCPGLASSVVNVHSIYWASSAHCAACSAQSSATTSDIYGLPIETAFTFLTRYLARARETPSNFIDPARLSRSPNMAIFAIATLPQTDVQGAHSACEDTAGAPRQEKFRRRLFET